MFSILIFAFALVFQMLLSKEANVSVYSLLLFRFNATVSCIIKKY